MTSFQPEQKTALSRFFCYLFQFHLKSSAPARDPARFGAHDVGGIREDAATPGQNGRFQSFPGKQTKLIRSGLYLASERSTPSDAYWLGIPATRPSGDTLAYAYAARYPQLTDRLVVMHAPVPGIAPWNDIVRSPMLWHFDFGGPDAERLVAGRERIYLDRFWNEFAGDPVKVDEETRRHYTTLYARPGNMRATFA